MQFYRFKTIVLSMLVLIPVVLGLSPAKTSAAKKLKNQLSVWQNVEEDSIAVSDGRQIIPAKYRLVRLNKKRLGDILAHAPQESAAAEETIFELPMPDGTLSRFRIIESPVMENELAKRFPEIKTYRGQGIDDPAATTRFDSTPQGFHAQILRAGETIYIDPYAKGNTDFYISYEKSAVAVAEKEFLCFLKPENSFRYKSEREFFSFAPDAANGTTLRTYRLALAATGEYTTFHGGTKTGALAAMTTTLNRVNGIYERDLAMRMILVAANESIIFTDAATDPYTNDDGGAMLGENQVNLDAVVGTNNYDIGHVFSTGGGGAADLRTACSRSSKAHGVTGSRSPVGDGFDVDYVAHEIGHQFGADHTFNGEARNCDPETRSSTSAYEPGSGITVMSYAGICAEQDLAGHSIDTFHVKSIESILNFVSNAGACAVNTPTFNAVPTVSEPTRYTIPKNTPFLLNTAASDADGDVLTYDWQQYNLGSAAISVPNTDADGAGRPLFRPFSPQLSGERTLPALRYILDNGNAPPAAYDCGRGADKPCLTGEFLPAVSRVMNFKAIVRDNRSGGGAINTAAATIEVDAAKGPFQVATQNSSPVLWRSAGIQTVAWSVNNSDALASNVKISLSIDGGFSFPFVLAEITPNDGAESVELPNVSTGRARIKIEAVGNIFFDINDADFPIGAAISASAGISGRVTNAAGRGLSRVAVVLSDETGAIRRAATNNFGYYRFHDVPTGKDYNVRPSYKKYRFSPQAIVRNHAGEMTDLNFTADYQ